MTIDDSDVKAGTGQEYQTARIVNVKYVQEPIAVIGMGCRLPGNSNSPHALWELLHRGGVANNEAPESRFDLKTHHDGSKKPKTMRSPGGMFLEEIDPRDFDAGFFEVPRLDAVAMDPQQRQLLEVVYECLENAGVSLESLSGERVGCFVGSYAVVDYADMQARDPEDRAPSVTIGVGRAILSNRISHFLNIKGPSLVAVDVACRYLQTREINGAIVAASNLYLSPEHNMDVGPMKGASSLTGKCHTFDIKADGYIKGEAVNAVLLKRLDDAIRDGDAIRAVIRGTATNSDGHTPGIASPSSEAQASAIRDAYANAGIINLNETSYLECHGTGTQAGDPTEVQGAASVFSSTRSPEKPLIIGSIKSNVGHSEPAAGISGLLKAILAIENGIIPGNPTFITPNPKIDFQALKVQATRTAIRWPSVPFRRASVNSFGYGGSNAHVVLEDPRTFAKGARPYVSSYISGDDDFFSDEPESTRPFVFVFSASDENSLHAYSKTIRNHLVNPTVKVCLPDLAFTLGNRRTHHFHRAYVVARRSTWDEDSVTFGKKTSEKPRIGFIFTGQGAQWSQMGKGLIDTFPQAREILQRLDDVLQKTPHPPPWSLIDELAEVRSPELLRQPEFSQPLCTALQLVLIEVLASWGVMPQSVAGHSSGEIAAAYAAGYLTQGDAIKVAYYRGRAAAGYVLADNSPVVGMLAAGLGPKEVLPYIQDSQGLVHIACFNSPNSVTLSGTIAGLEEVKARLVGDHHFARFLQVNLAYHSVFMGDISNAYEALLDQDFVPQVRKSKDVTLFSSVLGRSMDVPADTAYWKANMVSPVRFDEAVEAMLTQINGANFLIEIGPSGALAGAIAQIKKKQPAQGAGIQYCTSLSRGQLAINSLFDTAGKIFLAGGMVDLHRVNNDQSLTKGPSLIVDLPNYCWNHSTQYWYENESSKDWRYRLFPHHDLLGSKILGTSWHAPSWKKTLRVEDLPWLKDHKMGPQIVFPAAAFIAMAVEAISQNRQALNQLEGKPALDKNARFKLRDVTFAKALVLEGKYEAYKIMLTLTPQSKVKDSWFEFRISSLNGELWNQHSHGFIRIEDDIQHLDSQPDLSPLTNSTPGKLWYKAMHDAGYNFGPLFQKHLEVESTSGKRQSRSIVDLQDPISKYPQSNYHMHPACIDGCLQASAPSLWNGRRTTINAVLVPAIIDDIVINAGVCRPDRGIAITSAKYVGLGRRDETKSYMSEVSIYSPSSGSLLFKLSGLRYHKLDTRVDPYASHTYSRLVWKPDVTYLPQEYISEFVPSLDTNPGQSYKNNDWQTVSEVIDLIAHKKSNVKVIEFNAVSEDSESVWLDGSFSNDSTRATYKKFHYFSTDAAALLRTQENYASLSKHDFTMLDITQPHSTKSIEQDFDLAIVRLRTLSSNLSPVLKNIYSILSENGFLVLLEHSPSCIDSEFEAIVLSQNKAQLRDDAGSVRATMDSAGFYNTLNIPCGQSSAFKSAFLTRPKPRNLSFGPARHIDLVSFTKPIKGTTQIKRELESIGWQVSIRSAPFESTQEKNIILVLDELFSPIFPTINEEQWLDLRALMNAGNMILWVTAGSQLSVINPNAAMVHGLGRTVRAEDPSISFTTLDVESHTGSNTIKSIDAILESLQQPALRTHIENEYVERNGVIHVSRVQPDHLINYAEREVIYGTDLISVPLHGVGTTVRLQCERLGTLDSLCFCEVSPEELHLPDGCVEVEIFAAGLNFKDVAVTMGIVPENEHLLGLEGAGTIRRVGKSATSYKIGQRVLVFEKGCFGNRIIATTERVYALPDSMSFEEASTLPSVYLTAIYSIFDLANTKKGDRVLIHSASGGLGIASIQLCHYIGAEVFATVGTDEKRKFLTEVFGIRPDHIFNSRTTAFASELMQVTGGHGVDVILNSLTGDILDESWRCIATGGTMVELGKKDMLDRNMLSMEPFGRNASYRCFDMSHKHVSDALIARLLKKLMDFIVKGHIRPITPIKTFRFDDISSAFRFMRGANHIGKIVISNALDPIDTPLAVRPSPRQVAMPTETSILIVGGLKGLCGSLAVYLARLGAKHLVILSRSGYNDKRSQGVLHDIYAEGCQVDLVKGDVSLLEDVQRTFGASSVPVGGIIQGAMVLRDKIYTSMTISDYHAAIQCKVQGTWNLHNTALEQCSPIKFFSMLSSISGVVGQKGQANYAAANVFLDNFAVYRRGLGLPAASIDLGAIEDVGYMSEHSDLVVALDSAAWTPINEGLFHKIVRFSLIQQISPINPASAAQLITSIAVPQQESSTLLVDARFGSLCFGDSAVDNDADSKDGPHEIQALFLMVKSQVDSAKILTAAIDIINRQFMVTLRLSEPMEPAKPLSSYGLDSLSAVEFRNWVRMELGAELTTLEITNASSLISLTEKILSKIPKATNI
ncbi:beta-ketoacyl synthase domain-containing protein [Phlyctema vagabunda]|uniref:Beta-ketoacyl synthase domain-containing protein n=1 Tax=Phlyctema vagabunda TaxID=108571 RepID=A0ABR4PLQ2_9HELO